tara:strand:+ start:9222 stop:9662 length:441 start_codon:yes stop_codon:yes gene_type:complete
MIEIKENKDLVKLISLLSDDIKRKVGCVIVSKHDEFISSGSNTMPQRVFKSEDRLVLEEKNKWVGHAERNAIANAAKKGIPTDKGKIYCSYFPCSDCAISIIEAGIRKVYTTEPDFNHHKWGESWRISKTMFKESGVDVEYIDFSM